MVGRVARFDDLAAGRSWVFATPRRVLIAHSADDVPAILTEVQRATDAGSWAWGYLGYEAAAAFDRAYRAHASAADGPPLAWFALGDAPAAGPPIAAPSAAVALGPPRPAWTADDHSRRVGFVRDAIAAGSAYQVNLTTTLARDFTGDPLALYAAMAHAQRGQFNAFLDLGAHTVVSASPELFFEWDGGGLTTRPMKGTARRGDTADDDAVARADLLASPKQRAENLMIVDLLRNDLSRVATTGSVRVTSLFDAERYDTVWQLTSTVRAQPASGTDLLDVFAALFPCGSVTGAPKAAAMALIADLEDGPRGVYCGAVGMVAPPDHHEFRARMAVAIRTAVVDRRAGVLTYGMGGGITWSSDAAEEWDELLAKAAVLDEYGAGFQLLETLALLPGSGLRNLDRHLARMLGSAELLGFPADPVSLRRQVMAAAEALPADSAQRVRLLLHRDGTVEVQAAPLVREPEPVSLAVDDVATRTGRWTRHKTTIRAHYDAAAARRPDAGDVVLVDAAGAVLETTRASIACRLEGAWFTPPLSSGCLPGVERARLVEAGELVERELGVADLLRADDIAVISSLRGWRPARLMTGA